MLLKLLRQIEGDYVDIEALACLLQRSLIGRARSNEVVVLLQLWDAEVGGGVGKEDIASS